MVQVVMMERELMVFGNDPLHATVSSSWQTKVTIHAVTLLEVLEACGLFR